MHGEIFAWTRRRACACRDRRASIRVDKARQVILRHTVLVPDIATYERFLHDTQFKLPGITRVRSSIVLRELKSEVRLPL